MRVSLLTKKKKMTSCYILTHLFGKLLATLALEVLNLLVLVLVKVAQLLGCLLLRRALVHVRILELSFVFWGEGGGEVQV